MAKRKNFPQPGEVWKWVDDQYSPLHNEKCYELIKKMEHTDHNDINVWCDSIFINATTNEVNEVMLDNYYRYFFEGPPVRKVTNEKIIRMIKALSL